MKNKRRPFTLVEVLIVLALMALVASVVGFNIVKMRQEQKFRAGTAMIQQKMQAALETMLINNEDILINLKQEKDGVRITFKTETPLDKGLARLFNENTLVKGIDTILWVTPEKETARGEMTLGFSSISQAIPKGTLILKQGPWERTIVMKGYPHPIVLTQNKMFENDPFDSEKFYPKQVRQMWEANAQNR